MFVFISQKASQHWRSPWLLAGLVGLFATSLHAHEAWLLTPEEIEALAAEPMPELFASRLWLGLAAVIGCAVTAIALVGEDILRPLEARLAAPLVAISMTVGPLLLRIGTAVMLGLAALGGLPRHGVAHWAEPTFLVPDMQLSLLAGWGWLAPLQMVVAFFLLLGFMTRFAGLALVLLSAVGIALFGPTFLSYTPHFAAPGVMLALMGGGAASVDRLMGTGSILRPTPGVAQMGWRVAQILVGAGFVYLAVAYKLTQPTLLMAILEHGRMPTMGLSYALIALVMTGVEIICGLLLMMGRLMRPVAVVIVGAITFLAVVLNETPLFHANLYGAMLLLAMTGRMFPQRPARAQVIWGATA
ncbi:hypothetical protein [Actibacterium lipolyticum]|uniref:DoxX family protein n=1 Tax=Actibacterium lipolyticum TaxID=1524263 RepID=A0A238JMU1_9RHOB|nr:hypothetical protein [Actibacterium lipolyticum]SMX31990.1 hypothetical protein COL8621_00674 [Actibacterium lipolyticum]